MSSTTSPPLPPSLAELSLTLRRTDGDIPPPLVGCSATVICDALYLFGGRKVNSRDLVATLYVLNLLTHRWEQQWPPTDGSFPSSSYNPFPRYFHSATAFGENLVVVGGQAFEADVGGGVHGAGKVIAINDVIIWDSNQREWFLPQILCLPGVVPPEPRFAHGAALSFTSSLQRPFSPARITTRLTIIGGQNDDGDYIRDLYVLDLDSMTWIVSSPYGRRTGTSRSLVLTSPSMLLPGEVYSGSKSGFLQLDAHGNPFQLVQLPATTLPSTFEPLLVYNNADFEKPRRELDVIDINMEQPVFQDLSQRMSTHPNLPVGIRFPQGGMVGRFFIICGLSLTEKGSKGKYVAWYADLGGRGARTKDGVIEWHRLDLGDSLIHGSWNQSVIWRNRLLILGSRERDAVRDYGLRRNNFLHIAVVDLEMFGIYSPPIQTLSPSAISLGLATLNQLSLTDFDIFSSDGGRLPCSRKILEDRWPWFSNELLQFDVRTRSIQEAQQKRRASRATTPTTGNLRSSKFGVTPRSLELPLPLSAVRALIQYLYTFSLCTSDQLSTSILCQLLVFARVEDFIPNLRALLVHALHDRLQTTELAVELGEAMEIYEAATLGFCAALQVRALQVILAYASSPLSDKAKETTHAPKPTITEEPYPNLSSTSYSSSRSHSSASAFPWQTITSSSPTPLKPSTPSPVEAPTLLRREDSFILAQVGPNDREEIAGSCDTASTTRDSLLDGRRRPSLVSMSTLSSSNTSGSTRSSSRVSSFAKMSRGVRRFMGGVEQPHEDDEPKSLSSSAPTLRTSDLSSRGTPHRDPEELQSSVRAKIAMLNSLGGGEHSHLPTSNGANRPFRTLPSRSSIYSSYPSLPSLSSSDNFLTISESPSPTSSEFQSRLARKSHGILRPSPTGGHRPRTKSAPNTEDLNSFRESIKPVV